MSPAPFFEIPSPVLSGVHTVLTDVDDTLTSSGQLTADAYLHLERLFLSGIRVVLVTGRPAGWCDHMARMWPVHGVVGENGAFYMWMDETEKRIRTRHLLAAQERQKLRKRLDLAREDVLKAVAGCAVASDQDFRQYDLAIDFCEDVLRLPQAQVDQIVSVLQTHGLTTKVSSIHVNAWQGEWNKLTTVKRMFKEVWRLDLEKEKGNMIYMGDSPNDMPMFEFFPHAVGVANVMDFADRMPIMPNWITQNKSGAGFVEVAQALLQSRL